MNLHTHKIIKIPFMNIDKSFFLQKYHNWNKVNYYFKIIKKI